MARGAILGRSVGTGMASYILRGRSLQLPKPSLEKAKCWFQNDKLALRQAAIKIRFHNRVIEASLDQFIITTTCAVRQYASSLHVRETKAWHLHTRDIKASLCQIKPNHPATNSSYGDCRSHAPSGTYLFRQP